MQRCKLICAAYEDAREAPFSPLLQELDRYESFPRSHAIVSILCNNQDPRYKGYSDDFPELSFIDIPPSLDSQCVVVPSSESDTQLDSHYAVSLDEVENVLQQVEQDRAL